VSHPNSTQKTLATDLLVFLLGETDVYLSSHSGLVIVTTSILVVLPVNAVVSVSQLLAVVVTSLRCHRHLHCHCCCHPVVVAGAGRFSEGGPMFDLDGELMVPSHRLMHALVLAVRQGSVVLPF
jgi:hypothetical protein